MSLLSPLVISGGPCLNGKVFLTFERSVPWPDDEVEAIAELVATFVDAGQHGAFPCPGKSAAELSLELRGDPVVNDAALGFWMDAENLDARAFQLVRHQVSRLELAPPDSLRRIFAGMTGPGTPAQRHAPVIDNDNDASEYPPAVADPGFYVEHDGSLSYTKSRRILVELKEEIEGPPVDDFIAYVAPWAALLEGGALALPLGLPDVMDNIMGLVTQFDAYTLEIFVPTYQSSESGIDLLLNTLAAYHVRERPVRLVTIE